MLSSSCLYSSSAALICSRRGCNSALSNCDCQSRQSASRAVRIIDGAWPRNDLARAAGVSSSSGVSCAGESGAMATHCRSTCSTASAIQQEKSGCRSSFSASSCQPGSGSFRNSPRRRPSHPRASEWMASTMAYRRSSAVANPHASMSSKVSWNSFSSLDPHGEPLSTCCLLISKLRQNS